MRTYELIVDINKFDGSALLFDEMELIEQDWLSPKYLRLIYICDISVSDDLEEVDGVFSVIEDGELVFSVEE